MIDGDEPRNGGMKVNEHYHHGHPGKRDHEFCPRCGGRVARRMLKATEPARLVCGRCAFIVYDDPKVAACTIPILDDGIVLLKRGIEPGYGKWVFPGGFLDRGERVQDAAVRETREEVNLRVDVTRLLNVYSYPGYPVVVIVYLARVLDGALQARDETLEVATFARPDIPWGELAFPSTKDALMDFFSLTARRTGTG